MRIHNGRNTGTRRRAATVAAVLLTAMAGVTAATGPAAATVLPAPYGDADADGRIDLLSVSASGALQLWTGTGAGGVAGPVAETAAGSDFTGTLIEGAGNFNRGAYQQLPKYANNWIYVEPNVGPGQFTQANSVSVVPPSGTSWPTFTQLVSPGDITGHRRADLVARVGDQLLVYPNIALYHYGLPTAVAGAGWTNRTVIGIVDTTGDAVADLIARDDDTGTVWLYPGVAGGTFGDESTRVQIGSGLTAAGYPHLITKGDVTGDGHADIWAVGAQGGLYLLAGNTNGGFDAPVLESSDPAWTGIQTLG